MKLMFHFPQMIIFPFVSGILASMLHVFSGPDHLVAVIPFIFETKRKAWKIGLSWGLGHIIAMLIMGILFLLLKESIPIDSISNNSEKLVAFVLIGLGLWSFYRIHNGPKNHKHLHLHTGETSFIHTHKHVHSSDNQEHQHEKMIKQNVFTSFGIGIIHGLAGLSHFVLLIPAMSFVTQLESLQYIIGFAIGTIIAMTSYTFILGKISNKTKQGHNQFIFKVLRFSGALLAIIIGFYWMFL